MRAPNLDGVAVIGCLVERTIRVRQASLDSLREVRSWRVHEATYAVREPCALDDRFTPVPVNRLDLRKGRVGTGHFLQCRRDIPRLGQPISLANGLPRALHGTPCGVVPGARLADELLNLGPDAFPQEERHVVRERILEVEQLLLRLLHFGTGDLVTGQRVDQTNLHPEPPVARWRYDARHERPNLQQLRDTVRPW